MTTTHIQMVGDRLLVNEPSSENCVELVATDRIVPYD